MSHNHNSHINNSGIKMAAEGEYESVLCVKPDVNVYRIPPRASNRAYRKRFLEVEECHSVPLPGVKNVPQFLIVDNIHVAVITEPMDVFSFSLLLLHTRAADWKLDVPDWSGRMRITARGKVAYIKLEDKVSGELFAQAPVKEYPGVAVETVSDSSRYFVLRIQDDNGRSAFIGVGFGDRGDAFDFNVTLQDHFKWVKQENELSKSAHLGDSGPKLDLGFKEGQTITLNIGQGKKRDKPRSQGAGGFGLLPPPPGAKIAPPPSSGSSNHNVVDRTGASAAGCLLDLDDSNSNSVIQSSRSSDLWGEFSAPASSVPPPSRPQNADNWIQF